MIWPQHISLCTSTIESAVYENRTYSAVRGRRLVAASYSIAKQIPSEVGLLQDDFSDEKSVLADTKRKTSILLFFASTDGLRLPLI